MGRAIELAAGVRSSTSPNPWVGCVIEPGGGFEGATQPPGGPHAEVVALAAAGAQARGATLYTTLEPCSHTRPHAAVRRRHRRRRHRPGGRRHRGPRPPRAGRGHRRLREAGVEVDVGVRGGRGAGPAGPLPQAPRHRTALGGAQAGGHPRRAHRRGRRLQPVDHRRRGQGRRPPPAGRERRGHRRGGHGAGRRPRPHRPPRSGKGRRTRCGSSSATPRPAPGSTPPWS